MLTPISSTSGPTDSDEACRFVLYTASAGQVTELLGHVTALAAMEAGGDDKGPHDAPVFFMDSKAGAEVCVCRVRTCSGSLVMYATSGAEECFESNLGYFSNR